MSFHQDEFHQKKKDLILDFIFRIYSERQEIRNAYDGQENRDIVNDLERLTALVRGDKNWKESFTDWDKYEP